MYIISTTIQKLNTGSSFVRSVNLNRPGNFPCFWHSEKYFVRYSNVFLSMLSCPDCSSSLWSLSVAGCLNRQCSLRSSVIDKGQGFWVRDVVIKVRSESSHNMKACPNRQTTGIDPLGAMILLVKFKNCACNASISWRQSRKGVSAFTIWNSTTPIGVGIVIDPIEVAEPIPNCTLTIPAFVVSSFMGWVFL